MPAAIQSSGLRGCPLFTNLVQLAIAAAAEGTLAAVAINSALLEADAAINKSQ
jgi:hypothetical protein